jgi:hypothetical protein
MRLPKFGALQDVLVPAAQAVFDGSRVAWMLAMCSSSSTSLRRDSRRHSSSATSRAAMSAFCSASENPTSRSSRMTPTSATADSG